MHLNFIQKGLINLKKLKLLFPKKSIIVCFHPFNEMFCNLLSNMLGIGSIHHVITNIEFIFVFKNVHVSQFHLENDQNLK